MPALTPSAVNRTLRRLPNLAYRPWEYLTEGEVERLIEAARMLGLTLPPTLLAIADGCATLFTHVAAPAQVWNWQCAPKARIISGGRFHADSCRLIR
jgi:hypothetical protein